MLTINTAIVKVHLAKKEGSLRVVIPKEIREKLKIREGDLLLVSYDESGKIIYRKAQSL